MIVYICGPITGLPNNNEEAFAEAQNQLLQMGHHPINPHNVCRDVVRLHQGTENELWVKCMKKDIAELIKADAVVRLTGWSFSKGAMLELQIATKLGILIVDIDSIYILQQNESVDNQGA